MRSSLRILIVLFIVSVSLSLSITYRPLEAQDGGELPSRAELSAGWNELIPGGDTICSRGTPYSFFVRPAESEKVAIYFQGGGACWNGDTCAPVTGTFLDAVNPLEVDGGQGIFNFDNPENPLTDYNMVVVSYCTGDVHTGNNTVTYEAEDGTPLTIEHKGFVNANAVLDWVYANYTDPSEIVITGCSAGSYGSIMHAPYVMEQYPETPVYQIGDAGIGIIFEVGTLLNLWGFYGNLPEWAPDLATIEGSETYISEVYTAFANQFPENQFAQVTTFTDTVQTGFYALSGGNLGGWMRWREDNLLALQESLPNFRSFTAGGAQHCIVPYDYFYTYAVDGVRFRDWFADYIAGEPVENVRCTRCGRAEEVELMPAESSQ